MKTLLLTGSTGFLGSHLAHGLVAAGHRLIVLKRPTSDLARIRALLPAVLIYDSGTTDFARIFQENKINAVIHAATCNGRRGESVSEILDSNVRFPLQLVGAASEHGVAHFLNADTVLDNFTNAYALSKHQFVEWGRLFAQERKISFINLRLEHMYGPGDDESKFTARVIRECLNNVPRIALTPGEQQRDFIYVDDVVSAYTLLVERVKVESTLFQEYEVGSGVPVTIRTFVETVRRITGSSTRLDFGALPYRDSELMHSAANTASLGKLGWHCKTSLEEGIAKIVQTYREECQGVEADLKQQTIRSSVPGNRIS